VTFDATKSKDADGTIVSYKWREGNTLLSTKAVFSKSDFSIYTHTITLSVTDNDGKVGLDTVKITVNL